MLANRNVTNITSDDFLAMGCIKVVSQRGRVAFKLNKKFIAVECNECKILKPTLEFASHWQRFANVATECKECRKEYALKNKDRIRDYKDEWTKVNKGYTTKWREKNPERNLLIEQNRRARIKSLPHELTSNQLNQINRHFGNKCALTGEKVDLHLDHVIPLKTGHGGTVCGNVIFISRQLNLSKHDANIFEWFDANRERFNLSQRKFDELIEYLAQLNDMSTQEYRAYVDWCFDNPRDINEMEATG